MGAAPKEHLSKRYNLPMTMSIANGGAGVEPKSFEILDVQTRTSRSKVNLRSVGSAIKGQKASVLDRKVRDGLSSSHAQSAEEMKRILSPGYRLPL